MLMTVDTKVFECFYYYFELKCVHKRCLFIMFNSIILLSQVNMSYVCEIRDQYYDCISQCYHVRRGNMDNMDPNDPTMQQSTLNYQTIGRTNRKQMMPRSAPLFQL